MTRARLTLTAAAATTATMLAIAAPALAVERFASTAGIASGSCDTEATACTLEFAVESAAVNGDVVTVLPGTYSATASIDIDDAIVVRGTPGQARPLLNSTSTSGGVGVTNAGATLRRLEVVHNAATGSSPGIGISAGTVEQVIVRSNSADTTASGCRLSGFTTTPVIRDSICLQNVNGAALDVNPGAGTNTATLRNVTAVSAADEGIFGNVGPGETLIVNATNVIARAPGSDVEAQAGAGVSVTINLDHSNYATENQFANTTITDPGSGTNQTAAPVFVNAAGGDFHQAASSPTRNAGIGGTGLGSADFDGEARFLGTAPDIGADEFTEAPPDADGDGVPDPSDSCPIQAGPASNNGCPLPAGGGGSGDTGGGDTGGGTGGGDGGGGGAQPDTDDPETEITKKPKKGLKAGDTAKVRFESDEDDATFECKVAKGKFKRCTSPLKVKDLEKGKTKVQIRAIDAAGNVDETPAKLTIEAGGGGKGS